jgi:hypothetical protein
VAALEAIDMTGGGVEEFQWHTRRWAEVWSSACR